MGVLEEGAKAAGGVIEAMRGSPLAIANIVLNICFLIFLFYYVSRISQRAENTVQALFTAQDKAYEQWATMVKDTNDLAEKTMHCILPSDAMMLLQARPLPPTPPPERPAAPAPLERQSSPVFKLPPLPATPIELREQLGGR